MNFLKKNIILIEFIAFVISWIFIFVMGSDYPLPSKFYIVVIVVIFAGILQSIYLKKVLFKGFTLNSFFINNLIFLTAGLLLSVTTMLFLGNGIDYIWILIITLVGIIYGNIFWILNKYIFKFLKI